MVGDAGDGRALPAVRAGVARTGVTAAGLHTFTLLLRAEEDGESSEVEVTAPRTFDTGADALAMGEAAAAEVARTGRLPDLAGEAFYRGAAAAMARRG